MSWDNRARERYLERQYDLPSGAYDELLEQQGGKCGLCRQWPKNGKRLVVDHDHDTGQVRGLLCNSCNLFLGRAEVYLTAHGRRRPGLWIDDAWYILVPGRGWYNERAEGNGRPRWRRPPLPAMQPRRLTTQRDHAAWSG